MQAAIVQKWKTYEEKIKATAKKMCVVFQTNISMNVLVHAVIFVHTMQLYMYILLQMYSCIIFEKGKSSGQKSVESV
jgi:hypothetical protein